MDGCEMWRVAVDGAMGGCDAPRLLRAPPSFQRVGLGLRRRDQKGKGNVCPGDCTLVERGERGGSRGPKARDRSRDNALLRSNICV